MSNRIAPVAPETAEGATKEMFGLIKGKMGKVPNMLKTMAQSPALLEAYLGFSGALAKGTLNPQVRELIAVAVAQSNGCEYCLSAHTTIGKVLGIQADAVGAAREGQSDDPKTEAILRLAQQILANKGDVDDTTLDTARVAGVTDTEIAEVVGNVALNTFTNYFNELARPTLDFPRVSLAK
jgi:uncharacterized peroxidase-related enzyme